MRFDIITIFPDMFSGPLSQSILGRAQREGIIEIHVHDLRDFTRDPHRTIDDYPYGGGAGMVFKVEPLYKAIRYIKKLVDTPAKIISMSPQGKIFNQDKAKELARNDRIIIICGHYEGIDERIYEFFPIEEISIGDYILTGGELPAMIVIDAVSRMIPNVVGNEESLGFESFERGLLDYPHYTRPRVFRGIEVPEVLLSGNHKRIMAWRKRQAVIRTLLRRPELLKTAKLSEDERAIIKDIEKRLGEEVSHERDNKGD